MAAAEVQKLRHDPFELLTRAVQPMFPDAALAACCIPFEPADLSGRHIAALMLANGSSQYGLVTDFAILLATTAILIATAAKMYPRMAI